MGTIYVLQGYYADNTGDGEWEDLTAEETRAEALERKREYEVNAPGTRYRIVTQPEVDGRYPAVPPAAGSGSGE